MFHGNKTQLLKIFDPTLYLASTTTKDTLILDFSEILSSQAAVTIAKTFNKFEDGIVKFVHNLSSGCSRIDIVCDSYFDKSLKSDTLAFVDNYFQLLQKQPIFQRTFKTIF